MAFLRVDDAEEVLVVLNAGESNATVALRWRPKAGLRSSEAGEPGLSRRRCRRRHLPDDRRPGLSAGHGSVLAEDAGSPRRRSIRSCRNEPPGCSASDSLPSSSAAHGVGDLGPTGEGSWTGCPLRASASGRCCRSVRWEPRLPHRPSRASRWNRCSSRSRISSRTDSSAIRDPRRRAIPRASWPSLTRRGPLGRAPDSKRHTRPVRRREEAQPGTDFASFVPDRSHGFPTGALRHRRAARSRRRGPVERDQFHARPVRARSAVGPPASTCPRPRGEAGG